MIDYYFTIVKSDLPGNLVNESKSAIMGAVCGGQSPIRISISKNYEVPYCNKPVTSRIATYPHRYNPAPLKGVRTAKLSRLTGQMEVPT